MRRSDDGDPDIEQLKQTGDIHVLVGALRHDEDRWQIALDAARALVDIGSPATGPLIAVLEDRGNE